MPTPSEIVFDDGRDVRPELAAYAPMMRFLSSILGPHAEIALHDVSDPSRSIVALINGHLSGRQPGAPATDLVLKILRQRDDDADFLGNYLAAAESGARFRSSTFFIRDAGGGVVGMLCVNIDDTALAAARDVLTALTATVDVPAATNAGRTSPSPAVAPLRASERLSRTVEDLTTDALSAVVDLPTIAPSRMTANEKLDVVRQLEEAGAFLLKGAVARVASLLEVSEPSVYRYLRQAREGTARAS